MAARTVQLRSVDALIAPAVAEAISAAPEVKPADTAVVRLAKAYASAIDAADADEATATLAALGPRLLATLDALGCTPKARANRKGVTGGTQGESALDKLRADRAS